MRIATESTPRVVEGGGEGGAMGREGAGDCLEKESENGEGCGAHDAYLHAETGGATARVRQSVGQTAQLKFWGTMLSTLLP